MFRILSRAVFIGLGCLTVFVTASSFVADHYYQKTITIDKSIASDDWFIKQINKAILINPMNSEYFYRKYQLVRQTDVEGARRALVEAIRLEPTKDTYHAYMAILLQKMHVRPSKEVKRDIREELTKAYELKPLSPTYKKYLTPEIGK
jgi:hypothetical protein